MMTRMSLLTLLGISTLVCLAPLAAQGDQGSSTADVTDPHNQDVEVHLDPKLVIGAKTCEKCHTNEVQTWKQTPHSETFYALHRKPEAQQIASKMGVANFKSDSACVKCHYTMQDHGGTLEAVSGISCESCHGAAKKWIDIHYDYGGSGVTREQESPTHRMQRLKNSIANGMRNPLNVYLVAQSCYKCHTVPDERLVNVGGHKPGSQDFEIVAWSQGSVRHNFLRTNGTSNAGSPPERLRVLFVSGLIADLEMSLRATAAATEKSTFGVTSAKRADRAAKRLASAQTKINQPLIGDVLAIYDEIQLRLNNSGPLIDAADRINKLGIKFAATNDGSQLQAIDGYIPGSDRWK